MTNLSRGFTIVELLIVIVVIGILAAISIVAYNGIQNRAYDQTVTADLNGIAKGFEMYKTDNPGGTYPLNALTAIPNPDFTFAVSQSAYRPTSYIIYSTAV